MLYMLVCGPGVMARLSLFTADCVVHIDLWSSDDDQAAVVYSRLCCTYWSVVLR